MYLALQSLPTGSGRSNVGIFYKELTDLSDINTVANFAKDWNGFYEVTTKASAYSSLDLQADDKIGFIYEETLTGWGKRPNPVSTSFPTGAGEHNFDGFDNIYVAYTLEYITNGEYSLKRSVNRGEFVKSYLNALTAEAKVSDEIKNGVYNAINALGAEPTPAQIDNIYTLLASDKPADQWDGKILTFTNLQKNGTEYTLYIDGSNKLSISNSTAEELGADAEFLCKKEKSGKYSFYNESKSLYMIWRAGNNYGYNNNSGTLSSYNATYCDWSINDGSEAIADSYYLMSKRNDGSTDGALIILSSGVFDSWSSGVGYTDNYSNLFRIDTRIVETGIEEIAAARPFAEGIYDLMGRKVEHPTKGIYIIDGKVVYIK